MLHLEASAAREGELVSLLDRYERLLAELDELRAVRMTSRVPDATRQTYFENPIFRAWREGYGPIVVETDARVLVIDVEDGKLATGEYPRHLAPPELGLTST